MTQVRVTLLFWFALLLASPTLHAQLTYIPMPVCGDDPTKLGNQLKTVTDPTYILRAGAVGGNALLPSLKTLSRRGYRLETAAGAAQVALARLGDPDSLDELVKEIQGPPVDAVRAVRKLSKVRTEAAATILMRYVINNRRNPKRGIDEGDAGEDPMLDAIGGMIGMLSDPPYPTAWGGPAQLDGWETWWNSKTRPPITSIADTLSDEPSRCFARLAEAAFDDAVRDLYLHAGESATPALRTLANLGSGGSRPPSWRVGSIAEAILAKAGDQEQLRRIAKDLDEPGLYREGIEKLRYVGDQQAFKTLLHSLSLSTFPKARYYAPDGTLHPLGEKLQKDVMAVLSEMVTNPPLPPDAPATEVNIATWTQWWGSNKDKNVLKPVPF